ncbi:hypothetical protein BC2230_170044 [Burkholderia cepacia]
MRVSHSARTSTAPDRRFDKGRIQVDEPFVARLRTSYNATLVLTRMTNAPPYQRDG